MRVFGLLLILVCVCVGLGGIIGYKWAQFENRNREHDKELEDFFNGI